MVPRETTNDPTRDARIPPMLVSVTERQALLMRRKEKIMRRRTFDALLSAAGFAMVAVLIIAGGLLTWGHNFVQDNVRSQLVTQKVFFPDQKAINASGSAEIQKYVTPYAGQQVLTGQQAEVFADHYIKVHLQETAGGKTYSEVSGAFVALQKANPKDPNLATLAQQRQTLFMGETLRGLLLNAYAFGKMGAIAGIAAIVSFAGAGVLLVLSLLGLVHLRRVSPEAEVLGKAVRPAVATV
jgi:hypothetical protein